MWNEIDHEFTFFPLLIHFLQRYTPDIHISDNIIFVPPKTTQ